VSMDIESVREAAASAADDNGMVECVAAIDGVRDNGHRYAKGDTLHMHRDLVPGHVMAGQVKIRGGEPAVRQAAPATNRQQTGAADKGA